MIKYYGSVIPHDWTMVDFWKKNRNTELTTIYRIYKTPKATKTTKMIATQMLFEIQVIQADGEIMHYTDVIMTTMTSEITSLTVVYSTVYSDADQRKHQSSASLAFLWGIHRDRWMPRTKGQLRGKYFHLMTSSWSQICICHYRWVVVPSAKLRHEGVVRIKIRANRIFTKFQYTSVYLK